MLSLSKEQIKPILEKYNNGRFQEAIDAIKLLNQAYPNIPLLFNLLGACYKSLGQTDRSLQMFETAIKIKPDYAEAYFNQGVILKGLGRLEEAVDCYKKAIDLVPNYPDAHNNLGNTYKALGELGAAIESYTNAITFNPNLAHFHNNLGIVFKDFGSMEDAINSFQNAISINPGLYDAQNNLAITLRKAKRLKESLLCYERVNELKPDLNYNLTNILHLKMHLCIWGDLSSQLKELEKKINNMQKVIRPFALLGLIDDPKLQRKATEIYANDKFPISSLLPKIDRYHRHKKIRIGYFSADFHNHATMHLIAELFECHDKNSFELIAFSFGPDQQDTWRKRVVSSFDEFIDVSLKSNEDVALLSREMEIDIAIDLKGYTQNCRPGIFANTAAPIQVSFLGYPGTMAVDYMDYLIADQMLIPEDSEQNYSEKIVFMPNSYQVNASQRSFSKTLLSRVDLGLPEKGFVFCSFNNAYKITPSTFALWMGILKAVDDSVLWLLVSNDNTAKNLIKETEKSGINKNRLVFANFVPVEEHLNRIKYADLFVDTFPCNAHTTSSDALRMGLPVLTFLGKSFASRVTASLLSAVGLTELIISSQEEYEAMAIELGKNPKKLKAIKDKLAKNLPSAPLYDTPLFTTHLESAYKTMYEKYQQGLETNHIYVQNSN
jgi:predicted O-linked N-acetylglucosamine transferase (SPINDLY family)